MLIFPLKKEWYEKIRSGEKTIEYREVKPYWTKRLNARGIANNKGDVDLLLEGKIACIQPLIKPICKLRLGYTKKHLSARIMKIEIVNGKDTDLHIGKPVYAIHLAYVREKKF